VRVPESGEEIFYPGADHHKDKLLGEYIVQVGDTERIQVCAEFTEHDNGGPNGDDDVGTGCVEFVLSCDAVNGQPTEKENIGPVELCGPNQCNGSMSSKIQVMRADADGDCVENDDDFTPELCDEANKGSNGVALLQYFHFDDDALTTLVQTVGVTLQQSYNSYDFVVLLIDEESSNPFIIGPALAANGGALRKADLVFPPTRAGLMNAMQELTARGYRFDADIHAHGYKNGKTDSGFDTLNGGGISGTWLTKATEPDVIGTNRGGIPIVAWWSTTCWAERQLDACQDIGAVAASGSKSINFFPNTYTNYLWGPWAPLGAGWLTGATYRNAVDNSLTFDVELVVSNFLYAQGATPPWNYPHSGICPGGILGQNNCAEDFFMTGTGNDAAYNIEDVYDITQSGWANVNIAYERSFVGNDSITFGYFPPGGWN
jgi:hypothetical protein